MKKLMPKIFIGPMSKNVIESAISVNMVYPLGFCASRRQIEYNGGYVDNYTTEKFCNDVHKNSNIIITRDHGGPMQGKISDDGEISFELDVLNGVDVIHIDPWKTVHSVYDGIGKTLSYISFCESMCKACVRERPLYYEVGTEESIFPYEAEDLDNLLSELKYCGYLDKVVFAVIQSGTSLRQGVNTGKYNKNRLKDMVNVCRRHGVLSKEHNGDFISEELISSKFKIGLDAINIAPEFGRIETDVILENIGPKKFEKFYELVLESGKWKKWVSDPFDPDLNKDTLIEIAGHYVFSHPEFKGIITGIEDINLMIQSKIKDKLFSLCTL